MTPRVNQRGFSLLELLAAAVVLAVVVSITFELFVQSLRVADDASARLGNDSFAVAQAHLRNDLQRLRVQGSSSSWRSDQLRLNDGGTTIGWRLDEGRLIRSRGSSRAVLIDGGVSGFRWRQNAQLVEIEITVERRSLAPTRGLSAASDGQGAASRPTIERTVRLGFASKRGALQW